MSDIRKKRINIFRIIFTVILLIFVWLGESWALYLSITLLSISNEIMSFLLIKVIEAYE